MHRLISIPPATPTDGADLAVGPLAYRRLLDELVAVDSGLTCFGIRVLIDPTLPPNGWELRPR